MAANSLDLEYFSGDELASQIVTKYEEWRDYRRQVEERWEEVRRYKYATSTRETSNNAVGGFGLENEQKQGWSHSTHIPKLTQIADNLQANYMMAMFSDPKWIEFQGHDKDAVMKDKREAVEAYVLTKCRLNNFRNEIDKCVNDWVETGNCFGMVEYVTEKHIDPDNGLESVGYQGPRLLRISPYDIVFNPFATSFERSPKIIYSLKTMGELLRDVEECPELGYYKEVIEKAKELRSWCNSGKADQRFVRKLIHTQFEGYGSPWDYLRSGVVELHEFYGDMYNPVTGEFLKNHVITVMDRRWVIRKEPIKTWTGNPHIFHCGWRTRSESLWAMGPLENLVGMQYLINHLENTRADAFDEFVTPSVVTQGDVTEEGEKFGGLMAQRYHIDGADGSVNVLRPDSGFLSADLQIQYKEAQMEAYAGSPREAMGIRTAGEKTAYEVQQLQNAAGRIFQNKIDYFSEQFLEPVVNGMVESARRNLSAPDIVQITDNDVGAEIFLSVTKEDLLANGRIVPVGSRHFAEKAKLAQTLQVLNQTLLPEEKMHISSFDMAEAFVKAADVGSLLPVKKNIRVYEQAEMQLAATQAQEEVQMVMSQPVQ